jgi:hypothetical protein
VSIKIADGAIIQIIKHIIQSVLARKNASLSQRVKKCPRLRGPILIHGIEK